MIELQDVFQRFGAEYQRQHALSHSQHKAMSSICQCRSSELGGHLDVWRRKEITCSFSKKNGEFGLCFLKFIEQVISLQALCESCGALRVSYNSCRNRNCPKCGNLKKEQWILDRKSELLPVPSTNRCHHGTPHMRQNLAFHPHVHCIVPGGGLTPSGLSFVKSRKKFFIPVKVMSKVFKGKFMAQAENH